LTIAPSLSGCKYLALLRARVISGVHRAEGHSFDIEDRFSYLSASSTHYQ
jgi:hypothetical protein